VRDGYRLLEFTTCQTIEPGDLLLCDDSKRYLACGHRDLLPSEDDSEKEAAEKVKQRKASDRARKIDWKAQGEETEEESDEVGSAEDSKAGSESEYEESPKPVPKPRKQGGKSGKGSSGKGKSKKPKAEGVPATGKAKQTKTKKRKAKAAGNDTSPPAEKKQQLRKPRCCCCGKVRHRRRCVVCHLIHRTLSGC
jgi:hypothetical protein